MTTPTDPDSPGGLRKSATPELSQSATRLIAALSRKSASAGKPLEMYREALRALQREHSHEALHVAGYELREFMNTLPRMLDVPQPAHSEIRNRVTGFVAEWKNSTHSSWYLEDGVWDTTVVERIKGSLRMTGEFAGWFGRDVPSRRDESAQMLQRLAPTQLPSPESFVRERTGHWADLLQFFNRCAHHDIESTLEEFERHLSELEEFLLEHLEPRTFDDQAALDALLGGDAAR